jgi:hypothetical protein
MFILQDASSPTTQRNPKGSLKTTLSNKFGITCIISIIQLSWRLGKLEGKEA